jgi:peptidoglycan/LPS O-acetylase OafA/YrhL
MTGTPIEAPSISSTPPGGASNQGGNLANLDLLRAFAVVLVLVAHVSNTVHIRGLVPMGHLGVLLFFVHTSMVLMRSLARMGLSGRTLFLSFFTRRIFRVYPLAILAVLTVAVARIPPVSWGEVPYAWKGWSWFAANLLLVQNLFNWKSALGVLWSLPFELQMYLFLPALFVLSRRAHAARNLAILWSAAIAITFAEIALRGQVGDGDFLITRYFACFLAGVAAYQRIGKQRRLLPGWAWLLFLPAFVLLYRISGLIESYGPAVFTALHGHLRNDGQVWWPPWMDPIRDWFFCALLGLAIPCFHEMPLDWLRRLAKTLAKYSYGIYICHQPLLWLFCVRLWPQAAKPAAAFAVLAIALVSVLLYHLIEEPAIDFGKRLSQRIGPKPYSFPATH